MSWLLRDNWLWALLAFFLGALITWLLLVRRIDTATEAEPVRRPADDHDLVPAAAASTASAATSTPGASVAATKPTDESDAKVTTVEPVLVAKQTGTNPKDDKAPTKAAEPAPTAKSPDAASTDTRKATTTGAELDEDVTPPDDSAESPPVAEQTRPEGSAGTPDDTRAPDDSAESSRSADTAADQDAARSAPYGEGSAAALADGSAPEGFTIKGNADSMLYHTTDSPSYSRTKAEAWFRTEQDAERAGFAHWNRRARSATDDKESVTAPAAGPTASDEPSPPTASAESIEDVPLADDSAESSPAADQAKVAVPPQPPDGAHTPEPNDSAESSDAADTHASTAAGDSSGNGEGPTSVGTAAGAVTGSVDDDEGAAPYGEGSAAATADGSAPEGFTIKGNADSMLFHTTDSPYYGRTKAEVWFRTERDAERAGFTHWDRN